MRLLNRNNNVFDVKVTDEINKKISNLYSLIQDYEPTDLQFKYNVQPVQVAGNDIENSSFQIGKLIVLNFSYNNTFLYKDFVQIGKVGKTFDADLFITGAADYYPIFKVSRNGDLFIKGANPDSSSIFCYFVYITG